MCARTSRAPYFRLTRSALAGVTHLDVMRARTFVAEAMGVPPELVDVPVIGGHAGDTILPLLSQATPAFAFTDAEVAALTTRIQNAGTEARACAHAACFACGCAHITRCAAMQVVEAKAGAGSATLSMAAAAAEFADCCIRGLQGEPGVVACAYVASSLTDLPFFASKCASLRAQLRAHAVAHRACLVPRSGCAWGATARRACCRWAR